MDRSAPRSASLPDGRRLSRPGRPHATSKLFHGTKFRIRLSVRLALATMLFAVVSLAAFFTHSYRTYAKIVDARLAGGYLNSRAGIYAAPRVLRRGQKYSRSDLAAALRRAGYVEGDTAAQVWNGSFTVREQAIVIRPRVSEHYSRVDVVIDERERISELSGDGVTLEFFTLSPEPLTTDAMKTAAREQLSFSDIPPVLVQAITSIEDHRFFAHSGIDFFGIARALVRNAGDERIGQGGSTITQQLVKNTYLSSDRTFRRKFAEAMLAFTIERRLSKEDIFALYCNEIFLGQRGAIAVRGVGQAAHVYFGKDVNQLTLNEAATIAGMIQSPTRYSPVRQNELARERRNTVLGTMVRDGFITLTQAAAAAQEPLIAAQFDPAKESVAPYFIDYVNRRSAGAADGTQAEGPTITTLDLELQQLASQAVRQQLEKLDRVYGRREFTPQAALVAMDPHTGDVLAMVGGRDYAQSQLNRAVDAKRQPGSVFKPFVYAAALETGLSPLARFIDKPTEFTYADHRTYGPANYGGVYSMRAVPMRNGLVKSLNVVTVDVALRAGLARVANTAADFGLPRPDTYPALALGTTEVTPLQMAAAYAAFANGGNRIQPQVIATKGGPPPEQVIAPTTAFMITDMLQDVIDHGTARAARGLLPGNQIAGKTGTSRDGWFVGYTPNLVCAVWVGFDDNKQLGLTGAEAALPVWTEFIKNAVDSRPELGGTFEQPEGITIAEIDTETDALSGSNCPVHERIAMLTTQAPLSECFQHSFAMAVAGPQSFGAATRSGRIAGTELPTRVMAASLVSRTRVDTDSKGRRTLTNDLRAADY